MNAAPWDERYNGKAYYYGTEPNAFLKEASAAFPQGPVLCLAEGEGRNAAYLASLGHKVTATDQSAVGLAKANRLAMDKGLNISTIVADLSNFEITSNSWSGIVAIFMHLPPSLRAIVHRRVVEGLVPGGFYILEAYTPAQLGFGTGGPKDPSLLMTLSVLREELAGLEFLVAQETERDVIEGQGHTGRAAVVQILARRPIGIA